MVMRMDISIEDRVVTSTLREKGYSFGEIASKIGCYKCNKELWSIISGRSSLLQPAEVQTVLDQNFERFCNCLDFFKKPRGESVVKIQSDKTVRWPDFIVKLSSILNLDALQTYEVFQSYLRADYQGSHKHLQDKIECESTTSLFFLEVNKFYFEERLFLLKCLKYILSYWQDPFCLFRNAFAAHVDKIVNSCFIDQLTAQLKNLMLNGMLHPGIQGRKIFEKLHSIQGMREQREILEILLVYYNNFELSGQRLVDFATLFQRIKFGLKQPDKRSLDASDIGLIRSIGFLCCLVLLEGIDLPAVHSFRDNGSASLNGEHHIFANKKLVQNFDEIFLEWDKCEAQSPVVLAWSIVRYYTRSECDQVFEELGRKATVFDICGYLVSMLKHNAKQGNTVLSNIVTQVIRTLIDHAFLIFNAESLGSLEITCTLLKFIISSSDVQNMTATACIKSGIGILLETTKRRFPFDLNSYLDSLALMVQDCDSAHDVYEIFDKLTSMTELFDKNKLVELNTTDNPRIWTRLCDKLIINSGSDRLIVPAGSRGTISESTGLNLIRWKLSYSGWVFVTLYLRKHLEGPVIDNSTGVFTNIASIIELVKAIVSHNWAKAETLEPLISNAFSIIKRFHNCPDALDLISKCVGLLAVVAEHIPNQVVAQLCEICFIPIFQNDAIAVSDIYSTGSVFPCIYGYIMTQIESQKDIYPVTLAYLQFTSVITSQISSIPKADFHCYLANIKCVVEHIFGGFLQWKFTDSSEKKRIAKRTLEICYSILGQFKGIEAMEEKDNLKLLASELVFDCFMNGKPAESLLEILSVGVDSINYSLHDFSSMVINAQNVAGMILLMKACAETFEMDSEIEEEKELLIQVIKLAFAVINRLLSRKQMSSLSPLENGLCIKVALQRNCANEFTELENVPLINIIAKYIFHNNDPKLATLGVIVLRKICIINSVSVLASFGNDAHSLRNAYIVKLNSEVESVKLKIAIIDLLTTAVETQPGLVELFLHQHYPKQRVTQAQDSKDFGDSSCLPAILKFICGKKNLYPISLKLASVRFLHALWINRSDSTLSVIRARSKFWNDITSPLFELEYDKLSGEELDLWTLIMRILTSEIFYVANEDFDSDFLEVLDNMERFNFHEKIIKIFKCESYVDKGELIETKAADLVKSWRHFTFVGSSFHPSKVHIDSSEDKEKLIIGLISSFRSQVGYFHSKISKELSCTIMLLATRWSNSLSDTGRILEETIETIQLYLDSSQCFHREVSNNLFSIFVAIGGQYIEHEGHKRIVDKTLLGLASVVCRYMQELETDESEEKSYCYMLLLMINCLSVTARCLSTKSSFYDVLNDHATMPFMLSALKFSLKVSLQLDLANGIVSFYLSIAEDRRLAELLSSRSILLVFVASCSFHSERFFTNETWLTVLAFVAGLLKTSRYTVVDDAVDFVCAFKERFLQAANLTKRISSLHLLEESSAISRLLLHLSFFWNRCLFRQPDSMNEIKDAVMCMLQASVVFLSKPVLLGHIAGAKDINSIETNVQRESMLSQTTLQVDNANNKTAESSRHVQEKLIEILANTTGMVRKLCPDLLDVVADQERIWSVYSPVIDFGFGMPSLDEMMPISFGTFIASANTSLKILNEISSQESPKSSPTRKSFSLANGKEGLLRKMLGFIMDNSLVIMLSEATRLLRNAEGDVRTKQIVKRELGSEIQNFLSLMYRFLTRRNLLQTPRSSDRRSPFLYRRSPSKLGFPHTNDEGNCLYVIADEFSKQMLQ